MGLLNDLYDSVDRVKTAQEQKSKRESMRKALAKKKAEDAAKRQSNDSFGLF